MQKPIAIIGWGSLIWDLEILKPHVHGTWQMSAGPELPLEFSRVSPKRNRALAVCVDLMDGIGCQTCVIASKRVSVREARSDLARRERSPDGFIGGVCMDTGQMFGRPQVVAKVMKWIQNGPWAGAVWTDLHPTFTADTGIMFSPKDAHSYLQTLDDTGLSEAVRYIEMAPAPTSTRLRRYLRKDPWWQEQVTRVMGGA